MEEQDVTKSKLSSRKFIVWLIWLILTLLYSVIFAIFSIKTGTIPESLIDFSKLIVKYFFIVSCLYLGVNIVGKGITTAKDILSSVDIEE